MLYDLFNVNATILVYMNQLYILIMATKTTWVHLLSFVNFVANRWLDFYF